MVGETFPTTFNSKDVHMHRTRCNKRVTQPAAKEGSYQSDELTIAMDVASVRWDMYLIQFANSNGDPARPAPCCNRRRGNHYKPTCYSRLGSTPRLICYYYLLSRLGSTPRPICYYYLPGWGVLLGQFATTTSFCSLHGGRCRSRGRSLSATPPGTLPDLAWARPSAAAD